MPQAIKRGKGLIQFANFGLMLGQQQGGMLPLAVEGVEQPDPPRQRRRLFELLALEQPAHPLAPQ